MKQVDIFEAKTRLSKICEEVASTHEPVTVTKQVKPLVRIDPLEPEMMTIRERREVYMATHGDDEKDDADFEIPARKTTNSHDRLQYVLRAVWPQQVQRTIPGQHSFDHLS